MIVPLHHRTEVSYVQIFLKFLVYISVKEVKYEDKDKS